MTRDINDFLAFEWQKNGQVKIKHGYNHAQNIFILFRELGFRKTRFKNKHIFFRREQTGLNIVRFKDIKNEFIHVLETASNLPPDVEYFDILNWYSKRNPIKENGHFDHYLEDSLTEDEIHIYRLQTDHNYKHRFEIQQLLSKLEEWNFNKTIDIVGSFSNDAPLYYKLIENKQYLVFNHYNSKDTKNDGFDCWISTFTNEMLIGKERPLDNKGLRLSFLLERDLELISMYVN